jgi:histidinol-phosphate aminotransferase
LNDKDFLQKSAQMNAAGYVQLTEAFEAMGVEYVPSYGNFVLMKAGNDDKAGSRVNLALLKQGVIVRPVNNYGLPQWLRVSIGLPEENSAFLNALKKALSA